MALPTYNEIELPLLYELEIAGGSSTTSAIYQRLLSHFPSVTSEDLKLAMPSGPNRWQNMVQWTRNTLLKNGEIEPGSVSGYGVWAISELGRVRLARERHLLPHASIVEPSSVRDAGVEYEAEVLRQQEIRVQAQSQLVSIGSILHRFALSDFRHDAFQYDVIWKQGQLMPFPSHCFEVNDIAGISSALPKLKYASNSWHARLFLVVTDEVETYVARERLMPHFIGEYQTIGAVANMLTAEDLDDLYSALNPRRELLGAMLSN